LIIELVGFSDVNSASKFLYERPGVSERKHGTTKKEHENKENLRDVNVVRLRFEEHEGKKEQSSMSKYVRRTSSEDHTRTTLGLKGGWIFFAINLS